MVYSLAQPCAIYSLVHHHGMFFFIFFYMICAYAWHLDIGTIPHFSSSRLCLFKLTVLYVNKSCRAEFKVFSLKYSFILTDKKTQMPRDTEQPATAADAVYAQVHKQKQK